MGCCISSNNTKNSANHHHKSHLNNTLSPPPLEEETVTVKEVVLSELKSQRPSQKQTEVEAEAEAHTLHHIHIPVIREHNTEAKDLILINKKEEVEISQASEAYSITDTFSTATTATTTTTITEKREDEAISKPTTRRSPAKVPRKRPYTGEISRGVKSPAKRAEVSRSAQGRTMPRNVRSTRQGGSSVRRSRPPATRTVAEVGRSAEKVTARTGGRDIGSRLREQNEMKKEAYDDVLNKNNETLESKESLDNAHVSLECFIFL